MLLENLLRFLRNQNASIVSASRTAQNSFRFSVSWKHRRSRGHTGTRVSVLRTFGNVIGRRAPSANANCIGVASGSWYFLYNYTARPARQVPNFIRSFGNENGTRNRGLSRVNAARIPIDLIHPGVMMASEHKLHLV